MQEHTETTTEFAVDTELPPPTWLRDVRRELAPGGRFLVCRRDNDEVSVFPIEPGWTRIGRSVSADVRIDDPSVSRRHALLVSEPGKALRVLDDRSLNGVLINGEPVEWGTLDDGDELVIGRFRLFTLQT